MESCVSCLYLTYCMEYDWKSLLRIGIFQRATQRPRILLNDSIKSGGSFSVNRLLVISSLLSYLLPFLILSQFFLTLKIKFEKVIESSSDVSIVALDCIAQSSSAINAQCCNVNYHVTTNDWKSWEVLKKYFVVSHCLCWQPRSQGSLGTRPYGDR